MPPTPKLQRGVNKWGARIVPLILICLVGYATWVVPVLIGVNSLLQPPAGVVKRTGAGIAILVIYFILFSLMGATYLRVLQVVVTDPGYVPLPKAPRKHRRSRSHQSEKSSRNSSSAGRQIGSQDGDYLDRGAIHGGRLAPPGGLKQFYKRDVFECEIDGMPRWCSHCKAWKPDRSHHSSEVGRCIYKMDHFCPWAGGIISETNFKFFLQFCAYAALYCIFNLVVLAYYLANPPGTNGRSDVYKVNWIVVIALCGLFFIFSFGMAYNSALTAFKNSTTVDNLTRGMRIQHFAVLMPDSHPLVRFERERYLSAEPQRQSPPPEATTPFSTIVFPLRDSSTEVQRSHQEEVRVFAILASPTGSNPYLLTSALDNWRTVMGEHWYDWILPVRYSPCSDHGRTHDVESGSTARQMYRLGPVIEKMKSEVGLVPQGEKKLVQDRYGRRRIQR